MALLSAAKRLLIPNKNMTTVKQPEYGNDMRTIEIFNPINKLLAGSGVTLDPTDGTGPEVTISASGSGGGTGVGTWTLVALPEPASFGTPFGVIFSGTSDPSSGPIGTSTWPTMNEPTIGGVHREYAFVNSWWWNLLAGQDVVTYPQLGVPAFTGTVTVTFSIMAAAPDFLDGAQWQTNVITATPSSTIVTTAADFVNNPGPPSGDLSLGTTGMVTAAGDVYFACAQANVQVFPGTTFP